MGNRIIKLNESRLRTMVKESVREAICEIYGQDDGICGEFSICEEGYNLRRGKIENLNGMNVNIVEV